MMHYELIERSKNKIINLIVIILALILAFQFYKSTNERVSSLIQQQNSELEKNKVIEDIAILEKKADAYKKVFIKRDLSSIMDTISSIAKNTSVKIISVKPYTVEDMGNYSNSSFLIMLSAPSYHALGDFISKIENHDDIYLVNEISINSKVPNSTESGAKVDLDVNLKINTTSYL